MSHRDSQDPEEDLLPKDDTQEVLINSQKVTAAEALSSIKEKKDKEDIQRRDRDARAAKRKLTSVEQAALDAMITLSNPPPKEMSDDESELCEIIEVIPPPPAIKRARSSTPEPQSSSKDGPPSSPLATPINEVAATEAAPESSVSTQPVVTRDAPDVDSGPGFNEPQTIMSASCRSELLALQSKYTEMEACYTEKLQEQQQEHVADIHRERDAMQRRSVEIKRQYDALVADLNNLKEVNGKLIKDGLEKERKIKKLNEERVEANKVDQAEVQVAPAIPLEQYFYSSKAFQTMKQHLSELVKKNEGDPETKSKINTAYQRISMSAKNLKIDDPKAADNIGWNSFMYFKDVVGAEIILNIIKNVYPRTYEKIQAKLTRDQAQGAGVANTDSDPFRKLKEENEKLKKGNLNKKKKLKEEIIKLKQQRDAAANFHRTEAQRSQVMLQFLFNSNQKTLEREKQLQEEIKNLKQERVEVEQAHQAKLQGLKSYMDSLLDPKVDGNE